MDAELPPPALIARYPRILMAHGGGGRLMQDLIADIFARAFVGGVSDHDAAVLPASSHALAFTTDSYVVQPLFFPGGDIGSLAVHGTVNDLAMAGARPRAVSAGFILEEGLETKRLWDVACSMGRTAKQLGVPIVTGDTKVIDVGKGDGLYINTSGVGDVITCAPPAPGRIAPGDSVLVSGDLGRHGIAVLSAREGLSFDSDLISDSASVADAALGLIEADIEVHCLRDLTRGGLATALNELAAVAKVTIHVEESAMPVRDDVRGACELLGLDPLYVACEGRFVVIVPENQQDKALAHLREHSVSSQAVIVGKVTECSDGAVTLRSAIGAERILDLLSGEQLPRIC